MKNIIYYDQKYILQKMRYTFRRKYLEYRGPYQLRILQKDMPMPAREYESIPIFYVETDDHRYHGMLEVSLIDYKKGKVGQFYRKGGVIFYTKKEDWYYMSKYDDPIVAIRKAVNWARLRLLFLAIISLLFASSIAFLVLPLFG